MIGWLVLSLLGADTLPETKACAEPDETSRDYHLSDVCDSYLDGAPAYSITIRGSLLPKPASQQVILVQLEGEWFLSASGYRRSRGSEIMTRRSEQQVSKDDALSLVALLDDAAFSRIGKLEYYGSKDVICMDGSRYEVAYAQGGMKREAAQHSCAGETEINRIAAKFRDVALKYDPELEGMLYWMKG